MIGTPAPVFASASASCSQKSLGTTSAFGGLQTLLIIFPSASICPFMLFRPSSTPSNQPPSKYGPALDGPVCPVTGGGGAAPGITAACSPNGSERETGLPITYP